MVKIVDYIKKNPGLFLTLAIALIVRITYLYLYSNLPDWNQLTVDNNYHHNWALSILSGNIFGDTTYFRAPLYIYYLALIYKIFSISLWTVRIFGIVIGLLSLFFVWRITNDIFNKTVANVAAFMFALNPLLIYFESEILLDSFFTLLSLISISFFIRWYNRLTSKDIFVSAIFLGLSIITRPTALLFIPIFVIFMFLREKKGAIKHSLLFLVMTFLVIAPITIRNIIVADDPVLVASQGGINFYIGNNDIADGSSANLPEPMGFNWRIGQITEIAEKESGRDLKPGEVSSFWYGQGIDWIMDNKSKFLKNYFKKFYMFLSNVEVSNNRSLTTFFDKIIILRYNLFPFGLLFSLFVISLFLAGKEKQSIWLLTSLILIYIAGSSLFFFSSRFRLPLLPLFIIGGSYALYLSARFIKERNIKVIYLILGVVIIGLFSNLPLVSTPNKSKALPNTSSGLYYASKGDYQKALSEFERAYQIDSTFPEVNLNLGTTYMRLGDFPKAIQYFRKEIKLFPLREKAFTNIGSIFYLKQSYDSSIYYANETIKRQSFNLNGNILLLRSAFYSLDSDQLDSIVNETLERCGNNIYLLNEIGIIYTNKIEMEKAFKYLALASKATPPPIETDDEAFSFNSINAPHNITIERSNIYSQLSLVYGATDSGDKSIEAAKKAIELNKYNPIAYSNMAAAYLSLGHLDSAAQIIETGLEYLPDDPNLLRVKNYLQ